jgi:uncharacterized protein DUF5565
MILNTHCASGPKLKKPRSFGNSPTAHPEKQLNQAIWLGSQAQ